MGFIYYNNAHSITFIKSVTDSTYDYIKRSWYDLRLVPAKRPSVVSSPPKLHLVYIPGSSKRLDLTDVSPSSLTYSRSSGQWEFYVDTDKWANWAEAKRYIEDILHGKSLCCVLEDNHNVCYTGRFSIAGWSNEDVCPKVTVNYELSSITKDNNYVYNVIPDLLSISSSLMPNAPIFYLGDPLDSVRRWVATIATYENGDTQNVDVDSFGDALLTTIGQNSQQTSYKGKTSSVSFNVVEGAIVGIKSFLVSENEDEAWLGSSKNAVKSLYSTHEVYQNGYVGDSVIVDDLSGLFTELGDNSVEVTYDGFREVLSVFVKCYESLTAQRSVSNFPAYMRVGDYTDRLKYYLRVNGTTNRGVTSQIASTDFSVENRQFTTTGTNYVDVSASNKAIGAYETILHTNASITVNSAFNIINNWATVNEAIVNGTYKTRFKLGDLVLLSISGYYGYAQIVGFDRDIDPDGDTIPISWIISETLKDARCFNDVDGYISYLDSDIKAYVDELEDNFSFILRDMIVESRKEYRTVYSPSISTPTADYGQELMRLWLPSVYEIRGTSSYHKSSFYDNINYTSFFANDTARIKYRNLGRYSSSGEHYIDPVEYWTRDGYTNQTRTVAGIKLRGVDGYQATTEKYVAFGFCTDSVVHNEDSSWVLKKFRAIYKDMKYYAWDTFGLDSSSTLNNVSNAIDAEIDVHVIQNPTPSSIIEVPAITFSLISKVGSIYTYDVNIYDFTDPGKVSSRYINRFNMTKNSSTFNNDHYIINCTMITHDGSMEQQHLVVLLDSDAPTFYVGISKMVYYGYFDNRAEIRDRNDGYIDDADLDDIPGTFTESGYQYLTLTANSGALSTTIGINVVDGGSNPYSSYHLVITLDSNIPTFYVGDLKNNYRSYFSDHAAIYDANYDFVSYTDVDYIPGTFTVAGLQDLTLTAKYGLISATVSITVVNP